MIRIRAARSADVDELGRIELETARMFASGVLRPHLVKPVPAFRLHAAIAGSLLWVAEERGSNRTVGFVLGERHATSLHIGELDVHPAFGRRGIGSSLVAHVCEVAARLGLRFVTLTTLRHVPWNAPFYARLGFVCVTDLRPFLHLQQALRHERHVGLRGSIAMFRRSGRVQRRLRSRALSRCAPASRALHASRSVFRAASKEAPSDPTRTASCA